MINSIGAKIVTDFRVELLILEKLRKKSFRKIQIYLLSLGLILAGIIYLYKETFLSGGFGLIFLVMGFVLLTVFGSVILYYFSGGKEYESQFKTLISQKVIGSKFDDAEFTPNGHLPREAANACDLFSYFEQIRGSELVEGNLNNVPYRFSELDLTKTETYRDSDGDTQERTITIFHGILIELTLKIPIEINNHVVFLRKPKPFKFPRIFRKRKRRISLASTSSASKFSIEKEFYQKGNQKDLDHNLAKDLLKALLLADPLESFRDKGLSISYNKIYISLDTGDFLPIPYFRSPIKATSYKKWDNQLDVLQKIIEETTYLTDQTAQ